MIVRVTCGEMTLDGTKHFKDLREEGNYCIEDVTDLWEGEGFTIDHGGDDDVYELDVADAPDEEFIDVETLRELLDEVEEALVNGGYEA